MRYEYWDVRHEYWEVRHEYWDVRCEYWEVRYEYWDVRLKICVNLRNLWSTISLTRPVRLGTDNRFCYRSTDRSVNIRKSLLIPCPHHLRIRVNLRNLWQPLVRIIWRSAWICVIRGNPWSAPSANLRESVICTIQPSPPSTQPSNPPANHRVSRTFAVVLRKFV